MATHRIKGYVTFRDPGYGKPEIGFSMYKPSPQYSPDVVIVCEHEFDVKGPNNFDPRTGMVENLEEQKRIAGAAFAKTVKDIDAKIQSLLAIEHEA